MELTPEILKAAANKQVANVVAKLNLGRTLTSREQKLLDEHAGGGGEGFAPNWHDLAERLKRSRRCLTKWREKFKSARDLPVPRADGRHDVGAWLRFIAAHDLQGEPDEVDDDVPTKGHWDRLRAQVGYERELFIFECERKRHIETSEISAAVGQMLAGFRTALNTLPTSAARWVIGLRDFHQIKDKLQSEVDAVLQSLGRCDYLENLIPDVVAKHYGDRDKTFQSTLAECADGVLREAGRLALSDLLQRPLPASAVAPVQDQVKPAQDEGKRHPGTGKRLGKARPKGGKPRPGTGKRLGKARPKGGKPRPTS